METGADKLLLAECVQYFRDKRGFRRVLARFREKYSSLGHLGGTVFLQNLSREEKEALSGFLRRDLSGQNSLSLKTEIFQKCLKRTKFRGLLLEDILEAFFGEELHAKKDLRAQYLAERDNFFEGFVTRYSGTKAGGWLEEILQNKNNAYKLLNQRYDTQAGDFKQDLEAVCEALNSLPEPGGEKVRLPVFASAIVKNPHAFDGNTPCGQLLQYALMYNNACSKPVNAEERAELYYKAGLLIDEVSNYVLCSGLQGYNKKGLHPGWEGFSREGEPIMATLANLGTLQKVDSPLGKVFVLENPAVFSAIINKLPGHRPPLICTCGQLKIAALVLLDMLAREGTQIWYSGDYDPEGLLIADRLSARYNCRLHLWRYTLEDYETAISGEKISLIRLKKLKNLRQPELVRIAGFIRERGCAGYQELLLDQLAADVADNCKGDMLTESKWLLLEQGDLYGYEPDCPENYK